jgi:hypothetical protein
MTSAPFISYEQASACSRQIAPPAVRNATHHIGDVHDQHHLHRLLGHVHNPPLVAIEAKPHPAHGICGTDRRRPADQEVHADLKSRSFGALSVINDR